MFTLKEREKAATKREKKTVDAKDEFLEWILSINIDRQGKTY